MAKETLQSLQKQMAVLQRKADELKQAQIAEVIAKMKVAIDAYDITAEDLFGSKGKVGAGKTRKRAPGKLYADESGNTWPGRGPRPAWLREALEAGRTLEEFLVGTAQKVAKTVAAKPATKSAKGAKPSRKLAAKKAVMSVKTDRAAKSAKLAGKLPGKRLPKGTKPTASASKGGAGAKQPVRFSDGENNWSGRGSKPRWLTAAIESGRTQEEFAVAHA